MIRVVSVVWNTNYIHKQFELYAKNVKDCVFSVLETSTQQTGVEEYCRSRGILYERIRINEGDHSRNHALACKHAFESYPCDYLFLSDHDLFPVKPVDVLELMKGYDIAGVPQIRKNYLYMWLGLMIIDRRMINSIDFMPQYIGDVWVDSGGGTAYLLDKIGRERFFLIDEVHYEHKGEHYTKMLDDSFIHFIKGSNWNKDGNHLNRVKTLMELI